MRATILLFAAEGKSTSFIADSLPVRSDTVMLWQKRWIEPKEKLDAIEAQGNEKALKRAVVCTLDDKPRPGAPLTKTVNRSVK
jgi:hypothetical protein